MTSRLPIGQRLLQQGRIDIWQLQSALAHQQQWGGRLGEALVQMGFISEDAMLSEVALQLGVPYLDLAERHVAPAIVQLVPEKLIRTRRIFPIALSTQSRLGPLVVAMSEPQNLAVLDELAFATGLRIRPILASAGDIETLIERHLTNGHLHGLGRARPRTHAPARAQPRAKPSSQPPPEPALSRTGWHVRRPN